MKIAVIPGDGIGPEVTAAALRVLDAITAHLDLSVDYEIFDWGADRWLTEGVGLPAGATEMIRRDYRAVLFGAVGDPRVPDMAHGRQILLGLRRGLDLYVNHRPVPLPGGVVDVYRENTEGLYVGVGGTVTRAGIAEVAMDECVYQRATVQRFVRYCLADLHRRGRRRVTLVHKSNAVPNTGQLWQDVFRQEMRHHPDLEGKEEYVDAFCYHLIRDPLRYQGVLADNLFGDIVGDIGAALMGGLGLAASASICPETRLGLFEPVHGSAPDLAGTGLANPYAAVMSLALLLDHLNEHEAADWVRTSLSTVARSTAATPDIGGTGTTAAFIDEVIRQLDCTDCASRYGQASQAPPEGARS